MEYPVAFVNAFANGLFDGNTAAVVVVSSYPSDKKMLDTARLFGFSETAFLQSLDSGAYQIRWFTPEVEVPLCGHATLASAAYLFAEREKDNQQLRSSASLESWLPGKTIKKWSSISLWTFPIPIKLSLK
jgi:PhzF family phenazine biosynthesis protein